MYIQPNSDIIVLKNIPLDNTYDHTLWFQTKTEQYNWFYNYRKYTFNQYTYQRLNRGYVKVERSADDLYDCNYMMYRNTAYGTKWFYAFIKTVEYVNDNCTQIEFEIDVMQTWFFDYSLGESFVVREHSATDNIGDNLVPESVPLGDYVMAQENEVIHKSMATANQLGNTDWAIVVASNWDATGTEQHGCTATYQFSGIYYTIFMNDRTGHNLDKSATEKLKDYLQTMQVNGRLDTIFNIFYAFGEFVADPNWTTYPEYNQPAATPNTVQKLVPKYNLKFKNDWNKPDSGTGADAPYYAHNNKLYTFPFNFLKLTDYRGSEVDYKYEYFSNIFNIDANTQGYKFFLTGDLSCNPSVIAVPDNYLRHDTYGELGNLDYAFVLSGFPQCTWSGDAFTAWFAQTQYKTSGALMAMALGQIGRGVANGAIGSITGEATPSEEGAPFVGNQINAFMARVGMQAGEAVRKGTNVYGNESESLSLAINKFGIYGCNMKIRKDYAKMIDSYFDRFGYATMTTKVPNIHVRTAWTYTQTLGCVLDQSNMPADDAKKVCSIFDKGITFWDRYSQIGNYSGQTNNCLT